MRKFLMIGALAACFSAGAARAEYPADFPRSPLLKPKIAFWTKVFSEYSQYQSVIHYEGAPHKIYTVLDFRDLMDAGKDPTQVRRTQKRQEEEVKRRINRQLRRVHELRETPDALDAEERHLWALFSDSDDPRRFQKAIGDWRAQRGLRESTQRALAVSGRYLPEMERIFESYGLPTELTRLPLVESSFNVEAYSKVGAAGLWQFMPASARLYMQLNDVVDDRRDPWTSTEAAARHLRDDYDALGSWPLAITAYNHGRSGLARGLREVGGDSLEDLIERWKGRRFGFASRNFYAEFLAAVDVKADYRDHFGDVDRDSPVRFETVSTEHFVPYDVLRRCAGVDDATFRQLNPAYRPEVIEGKLYVPPAQSIRVPRGHAETFRQLYAALGEDERFDEQRFYHAQHRVQAGDTLDRIARRHGVSLRNLLSANPDVKPSRLRIGQTIRVPPRDSGGRGRLVRAVDPALPESDEDGNRLHRVRPGQTLSHIARSYRVTVVALRDLNRLDGVQTIRAGSVLKIPAT